MSILTEIKDPRVRDVTVTQVDVAPDMRSAKVHVSVMGDDKQQKLSLYGLQSAAGFLQSKLADPIETRYTPRLSFELDMGVKKSIEMARILKEVLPPDARDEGASGDKAASGDDDSQGNGIEDEGVRYEDVDAGNDASNDADFTQG